MAEFRPGDAAAAAENKKDDEDGKPVPPAKYIFAFVQVRKKTVGQGEQQWHKANCKSRVLWAPPECKQFEGKHFWITFGLNVTSPGQAALLSRICAAMGLTNEDAFDPMKLNELQRAMQCRPMASELKVTTRGQYKDQEWGKIIPATALQQETLINIQHWRKALLEEFPIQTEWGGSEDPGPSDQDAPAADERWRDLPF